MQNFDAYVDKLKQLLYKSKPFTFAIIALLALSFIAFPGLMMLILSTTVVFIFIKGFLLILKMISDK